MRKSPTYQARLCWNCGNPLAKTGFRTVIDPLQNKHLVHGICYDFALEDQRQITAQEREMPPRKWEG